ncbi:MAG TPA: sortase [Candidatus Pacearchaeota archaeon]|nr:sortase [Candidatus Pacearchaeota archaeon]HOK94112.1 sortase [Candidatus Pacearchaeota archaeon]HPO75240.1 sortase [Candidatus Pacearchaeota archaeon]
MLADLKIKIEKIAYENKLFWEEALKAIISQIVCFAFFFFLEKNLNIPLINFSQNIIFIISGILLFLFLLVTAFSLKELHPSYIFIFETQFKNKGIYSFVRHPFYAAIIFFLNPAIAFLLRSAGLLFACFLSYFIWKKQSEKEEEEMIKKIGDEYRNYQIEVPQRFFPPVLENIYLKRRALFYILAPVLSSLIIFFAFNLYLSMASSNISFNEEEIFLNSLPQIIKISDDVILADDVVLMQKPISNFLSSPAGLETNEAQNSQETNQPDTSSLEMTNEGIYKNLSGVISISKINIQAPIIFVGDVNWVNYDHKYGIVHYPDTALPGEEGAILLSGHSSAPPNIKSQYNFIFSGLDKLEAGDEITITFQENTYTYKVFRKEIVLPQDFKLREYKGKETVTLLSCWPVGTAARRIVVEAERIE